jgi:hypothetical protein
LPYLAIFSGKQISAMANKLMLTFDSSKNSLCYQCYSSEPVYSSKFLGALVSPAREPNKLFAPPPKKWKKVFFSMSFFLFCLMPRTHSNIHSIAYT